jgi:hypothetical protein
MNVFRQVACAIAGWLSLIIGGCVADRPVTSQVTRVVLLGHDARESVLRAIADDHDASEFSSGGSTLYFATPAADADGSKSLLETADVAIIVIDAGEYKPSTFESCAELLAQKPSVEIVLLFANTGDLLLDKPDAVALLELSELDVREYLNTHGLDGDNVAWFYDSQNVIPDDRPPMGTNLTSVVNHIGGRIG